MSRALLLCAIVGLGGLGGLAGCDHDVCEPYGKETCIALQVTGGAGTTLSSLHVVATGFPLDVRSLVAFIALLVAQRIAQGQL